MTGRSRLLAAGGLLVPLALVVVIGVTALAVVGAPPPATPLPGPSDIGALPTEAPSDPPPPSTAPSALPSASFLTPAPSAPLADALLGTDGRLTVLLLGSDARAAHPGNRTDAVMVVSIDPTTGQSAAFSVPRDTVDFPMPTSGTYGGKVNALFQHLQAKNGRGASGMKQAVSRAFGIEIDNYVLIGFTGVLKLVKAVGGVDVTLETAYYDPYYWVNNRTRGWGLPKGKSHLNANDALIFARSRKGDSDFGRARRQQILIMAAVSKVRKRGLDDLPQLISIAKDWVRTDLPLDRADDLFEVFGSVDLADAKQAVFGPSKYAERAAPGSYDYRLKLAACKAWIEKAFPTVRPYGTWPAAPASPVPAPAGSPAPSPSPAG
ncbi:MAG: LCP family protein [Candidatus Limnocylindrales bacterium]